MRTAWGYDVDNLDPILSVSEFHQMTGNAYAGDSRVETALAAASQAIRNYCGWHICPSMECTAHPVGGAKILKLPAGYVSAISAVTEDGAELTGSQYEWRHEGLMRRTEWKNWSSAWDGIEVEYTAGYEISAVPDLAEAIRAIAEGVIAVSPGVMSESADGVSISYSQNASSIAAALTTSQKTALEIYKVVNSHAA